MLRTVRIILASSLWGASVAFGCQYFIHVDQDARVLFACVLGVLALSFSPAGRGES